MDKKKVVIVGCGGLGSISGWVAKALGEMAHYDVERIDIMEGYVGGRPDLLVWDEESSLIGVDFKTLEDRFSGLFDAVLKDGVGMYNTGTGQTITVYQMLAVQTEGNRSEVKDRMFLENYGHRGSGKSIFNTLRYKAMFCVPPTDHPTRKREPKGPRGKWGKLK